MQCCALRLASNTLLTRDQSASASFPIHFDFKRGSMRTPQPRSVSFRCSLGSHPQNSSFLWVLYSRCPHRVPSSSRVLNQEAALSVCTAPVTAAGLQWELRDGGDGGDLGGSVSHCSALRCNGGALVEGRHLRGAHWLLRNPEHLCVWCKKSVWESMQRLPKVLSNVCAVLR